MKILVVAEHRDGQFKKVTFETVRAARTAGEALGAEVVALVLGTGMSASAGALGGYGAQRVLVVEQEQLNAYSSTAFAQVVADAVKAIGAGAVFFPATAFGKDLAPRVAARLEAGLAADCVALSAEGGSITATRPVFAGKALTEVKVTSPVGVYTLRPNVFPAGESSGATAPVEKLDIALPGGDFGARTTELIKGSGKRDVAEAEIIVSGGRGLKGPENFRMLEELAEALGAAVGASRAVVDAGWRPHEEQVGQTGKTVSPTLYIAVGISGAIQHLAGMSSSKYIVAINKDKDAPIFQIADYGIVGDALDIVPVLTSEVNKVRGQ